YILFCFFFQAEDGIRDRTVTGVQTCALPIWQHARAAGVGVFPDVAAEALEAVGLAPGEWRVGEERGRHRLESEADTEFLHHVGRSEERRVGKECRCGWWADQ